MHGKRLSPTQPARLALGLVSMLALLAFAFPIVAQATPASGVQYSDAPPTATGDNPPKKRQAQAKSSQAGGATAPDTEAGGGSAGSDSSGPGSSGQGSSSKKEADASAGNRDGRTGQGSPGADSGKQKDSRPQSIGQAGTPAAEQEDDGSSPLIPILIAILVLAAISVAAVMIRQRRQGGSGTPVSPKAS